MNPYEYLLFAAGCIAVWLLMAYQARHEGRHADAVGSVCEGVDGAWCGERCEAGAMHCEGCGRIVRAKAIKGESR